MIVRVIALAAVALALGGCLSLPSVPRKAPVPDSAPRAGADTLQRLASLPDPEVRAEPRSKWGNGPVYSVLGKSYRVMAEAEGFVQEGRASWYGTKFHGRRTSNGERFDMYGLSAAHRHLPLPSYVKVTNLANGRATIVRVNDRGPFHADRVIDLSYAAAVKLGFHRKGTTRVRIEVQEPGGGPQLVMVQAGAFRQLANADRLHQELSQLTGLPGVVVKTADDGYFRVQLGPVNRGAELERVRALLQTANHGKPRVVPAATPAGDS